MRPVRRLVPPAVRQRLKSVLAYPATLRLVSDARSFRQLRRLESYTTRWGEHETTVALRLRELGGEQLHVRPGAGDRWVLRDTFLARYHLPPARVADRPLRVIWDLGAHIGTTMAHFAARYPSARIVGVELDPDNAQLCRRNVAPWGKRMQVFEGAVWHEDAEVEYAVVEGYGLSSAVAPGSANTARGVSLDRLLVETEAAPGETVDYVKMDIEGAEREVLRHNTAWAGRVSAIKVEVHPPYTTDECIADLRALGFDAFLDESPAPPAHPSVAGVRGDG